MLSKKLLIPSLIGILAFFAIFGFKVLDPTFDAWLSSFDLAQHYLGWLFFRKAEWTFPIGVAHDLGLELSSSIVYSATNPLLAFIFKVLDPFLPDTFQYVGIWFLVCFILQGIFSYKLLRLFIKDDAIAYLGVCFFVFSPFLIHRWGHETLCAHWLIIASWYYYFNDTNYSRIIVWSVLLSLAVLTQAYFLPMVSAIWFASLLSAYMRETISKRQLAWECITVLALPSFLAYLFGYFTSPGRVSEFGFGFFKMNLLSLIDSSGWSYILRDIPQGLGEYEGFQFLGLGIALLILIGIVGIDFKRKPYLKNKTTILFPLLLVVVFFTIISVTNVVGFGSRQHVFPIPQWLQQYCSIFRSSGRFFWVVSYLIMVLAVVGVFEYYPRNRAFFVIFFCCCVQVIDSSSGWWHIHNTIKNHKNLFEQTEFMKNKLWSELAKHYDEIRVLPVEQTCKLWKEVGYFAVKNDLGTDCIYFARVSPIKFDQLKMKNKSLVEGDHYKPKSMYIVDRETAHHLHERGVQYVYKMGKGFFTVLKTVPANFKLNRIDDKDLYSTLVVGKEYRLGESKGLELRDLLLSGWQNDKKGLCWSKGEESVIAFLYDGNQKPNDMVIEGVPLLGNSIKEQRVDIYFNGALVKKISLDRPEKIVVPLKKLVVGKNILTFKYHDAARPIDLGINLDQRTLALGVRSILFTTL